MELKKARMVVRKRLAAVKEKLSLNLILGISVLILSVNQILDHNQTVLVPPHLSKEAKVAYGNASVSYLEPWAVWLVGMTASVTPSNADVMHTYLEPYFPAELWKVVGPQILNVKKNPKFTGVNVFSSFITQSITYEPSTKKFYITGKLKSSQYRKGNMEDIRAVNATYEVKMDMDGRHPIVKHWMTYVGNPMTEEWIEKHPEQYKKRLESMQVDDTELYPRAGENDIITEKDSGISISAPADPAMPKSNSASQAAQTIENMTVPPEQPDAGQGIHPPAEQNNSSDML